MWAALLKAARTGRKVDVAVHRSSAVAAAARTALTASSSSGGGVGAAMNSVVPTVAARNGLASAGPTAVASMAASAEVNQKPSGMHVFS